MIPRVPFHRKEHGSLIFFLKDVLNIRLYLSQAKNPGRFCAVAPFSFCGGRDHCGIFKWPEAGFWTGDHIKGVPS